MYEENLKSLIDLYGLEYSLKWKGFNTVSRQFQWVVTIERPTVTCEALEGHMLLGEAWSKPLPLTLKQTPIPFQREWRSKKHNAIPPSIEDALSSFLSDASGTDESFDDWCDTFGLSSDSIKALEAYRECCNTARKLRNMFSHVELEALQEAAAEL